MAELRPYSPSWRDRVAAALIGGERASPERRRFVEGLLGSSGLGSSGASVADFTPAGVLFAGDEFQRAKNDGSASGAAMAAMGLIPAARGVAIPAQTALAEGAQGIRAYHGSPHSFDRFDINKIGTGEGAQAYGHGLYFAENEGVARSYRDELAPGYTLSSGIPDEMTKRAFGYIRPELLATGNNKAALDDAIGTLSKQAELFRRGSEGSDARRAIAESYDAVLARLRGINPDEIKKSGSMYEVNIRANPEDFLDWDKPIAEQSEAVRKAFLKAQAGDDPLLQGLLDTSPEGLMMQGIMPGAKGSAAYKTMAFDDKNPLAASNRLREAGIPGIKYLDQGSRGAGEGSRNYVVFDDKLIDILRKYGLAGLSIGGAGGLATSNGLLGPSINEGM
jgi:hypothetical protein